MPEGDTLHRTAAGLRPVLVDGVITRFEAPRLVGERLRVGDRVVSVEAVGKHLLITVDRGLVLRTHLGMPGSWHRYRSGERWRLGAHLARVVLEVDRGWVAVCFRAPTVDSFRLADPSPSPVDHLGPDLVTADPDLAAAVARWRSADAVGDTITAAEALLDQRRAAGIGNVYKSEVLWLQRIDPFRRAETLRDDEVRDLYTTAHRLLRANLTTARRITYGTGHAVYGRAGMACPRCSTPIRRRHHGTDARSTYWCPDCQPPLGRRPDERPR